MIRSGSLVFFFYTRWIGWAVWELELFQWASRELCDHCQNHPRVTQFCGFHLQTFVVVMFQHERVRGCSLNQIHLEIICNWLILFYISLILLGEGDYWDRGKCLILSFPIKYFVMRPAELGTSVSIPLSLQILEFWPEISQLDEHTAYQQLCQVIVQVFLFLKIPSTILWHCWSRPKCKIQFFFWENFMELNFNHPTAI